MSNSTALAIRDDQIKFDEWQEKALVHMGVDKADGADLAVFFHTCKRTGLDPFARQIYMIQRWTKDGPRQTIQTGIDGFRLIAQRTCQARGERLGYEDTLWCDDSGEWHDVWIGEVAPTAAKVTVLRDGQRFPAVAVYREYVGTKKDGNPTQMWASKPALMIAKCAEALALRKAFPLDLSGLYTADEMHHEQPRRQQTTATLTAADFQPAEATPDDAEQAEWAEEAQS